MVDVTTTSFRSNDSYGLVAFNSFSVYLLSGEDGTPCQYNFGNKDENINLVPGRAHYSDTVCTVFWGSV